MLVSSSVFFGDLGKELHAKFGKEYPKCAKKDMPRILCRIGSFFNSEMSVMNKMWGLEQTFDNTETKEILGIDFKDWKVSVHDMVGTL